MFQKENQGNFITNPNLLFNFLIKNLSKFSIFHLNHKSSNHRVTEWVWLEETTVDRGPTSLLKQGQPRAHGTACVLVSRQFFNISSAQYSSPLFSLSHKIFLEKNCTLKSEVQNKKFFRILTNI